MFRRPCRHEYQPVDECVQVNDCLLLRPDALIGPVRAREPPCASGHTSAVTSVCAERQLSGDKPSSTPVEHHGYINIAENKQAGAPTITRVDPQAETVAKVLAWISRGWIAPSPDDIAMVRLVGWTVAPSLAGLVLAFAQLLSAPRSAGRHEAPLRDIRGGGAAATRTSSDAGRLHEVDYRI